MSVCIKDLIQNMNLVIGCKIGCSYCYARNNVKRFHTIDDFNEPVFFPNKLKLIENKKPHNYLVTGMSDLSGWNIEWRETIFDKIKENPQHQFLFLSKRPDLLNVQADLDNAWFGVTVTGKADVWKINELKKNVKAKHYHVTFEPLFDDPGYIDLTDINWIVIGTMTGVQKTKIQTNPKWVYSLLNQAREKNIPVFMKEDLIPIMGENKMIQELPYEFKLVLEEQQHDNK